MTFGSHSGTFSTFNPPPLSAGLTMVQVYSATDLKLVIQGVPEPGSLALVGTVGLAAGWARRRRRHV
jgi:hypothetical protein